MRSARLLRDVFARNGYLRVPDWDRKQMEGHKRYKKGWEVRLVLESREELARVRAAMRELGFPPARSFEKHSRLVQPLYGRAAVEWFSSASSKEQ